ncbi:hypothetical protein ACGFYY_36645 [Streptomyces sp. NPDC048331]|uniref:hypothetical protein n=1 Tax=Streptomyces sp. NPDC048331 TaxID=3365534 RepID=UPI00372096FD
MDLEQLRAIIADHTKDGTLTLPGGPLGPGPAADLINTWWDGTLTVSELSRQDRKNGPVRLSGRAGLLKVPERPVAGVEFGIADGAPTLYFPFPLPVGWTWATSFPQMAETGLNTLAWQAEPAFLLASHPRPAAQGRPRLAPGLTFHSLQTKLPHHLTDLSELLGISGAVFGLTGTAVKTANGPRIQLRSPGRELGALGASFHLWGGSLPEGRYELRLAAELRIDTRTSVVLSAPAGSLPKVVTLRADALPAEVTAGSIAKWEGTGEAAGCMKGFPLGKSVRLSELSLDLDPAELKKGPAAAITALRVKLAAGPDAGWKLAGGVLTLSKAGADFTVERPLAKSDPPRKATALGTARLDLYDVTALNAEAAFPPGTFSLKMPDANPIHLRQTVERICPGAQVDSLPDLKIIRLEATADKEHLALKAEVEGEWAVGVGAARMTLTEAKLSLAQGKPPDKQAADGGRKVSGELTAKATLGLDGSPGKLVLDTKLALPGQFGLKGEFKELTVDKLLRALAEQADMPLPRGFPTITLPEARAELTVGSNGAGTDADPAGTPTAYDLVLAAKAEIGKNTSFRCIGRAGRDAKGKTLFAAALWTEGSWSPAEVGDWDGGLKQALKGITFQKSGFAFATRDGVKPGGEKLPDTLPKELSKGVTLFTEVRFSGVLAPVAKLFNDSGGLALRARLAAEIVDSEFVVVAPKSRITGMEALTLTLKPADMAAALVTQLTFSVKNTDGSTRPLTLTAGGRLSLGKQEFSLFLVLQGGATGAAGTAELLAYALDGPGYLAPRTNGRELGPAVRETALELAELDGPPSKSPAWPDAFGIKGLDVQRFYVQVDVSAQAGLGIGMGGRIKLGNAQLALDAHGGFNGAPYIDVFRFSLDTATAAADPGVTLWEILVQLAPGARHANWLKPLLDGIRLYQLLVVFVAKGTKWQSPPPLKESWDPGFSTKGHLSLYGISWRFELSVAPTGIHAFGSMDKKITLGDVLVISSTDGRTGPSYQLDTRTITGDTPARKTLLHLDARVRLLGADIAAKIDLGASGWSFRLAASIDKILKSAVLCTLDDRGLTAAARLSLALLVELPTAIGPLPKGKIGVTLDAAVTLSVTTTSCKATLDADCKAFWGPTSIDFKLRTEFGVASWADFAKYLKGNPEILFAEVGKGIWKKIEDCAMSRAATGM